MTMAATNMIKLKDAPGGERFIESLTEAVKTLSLLYAGTPESYVAKITPDAVAAVGPDGAAKILEAFAAAVMGRKHELEAEGGGSA
jgi:hypothetical protein